ncbi:MAG TPA: TRAP transporter substrate-binding protein DctP [Dehalococcoidia bacterium]|nr:TRAP transporter substrate-binding protein DctP [Dehalococcoidia bacterium]
MKNTGLVILTIVILSTIIAFGCGPAATTTPTTSAPPTSAAPAGPIEISFQHTLPPVVPFAKSAETWAKNIESRSNGKVKFTFYWSSALVPQQETFKAVQTGVLGACYFVTSVDYQPLNFAIALPSIGVKDMSSGTDIYHKLLKQFPEMMKEYEGVILLASRCGPPSQFHNAKREVKVPTDMKGLKMNVVGREMSDFVEAAGAASVMGGAIADAPTNLQTGVTDGMVNHWPVINVFGLMPYLPYHTNVGGGVQYVTDTLIMNPKIYNSLPADVQKIVQEESDAYAAATIKLDIGEIQRAVGEAQKANQKILNLTTPQEIAPWEALAKPIWENWAKRMEDKGKPGNAVLEATKKLVAESKPMDPTTAPPAAPPPAGAPPAGAPPAGGVVGWKAALEMTNFGSKVTVTGVAIDSMSFMPPETLLFIGDAGGDPMASFPLVIPDPSKGFPDLKTYKGKTLEATGELAKNNFTGKAQMNITSPDQIKVK